MERETPARSEASAPVEAPLANMSTTELMAELTKHSTEFVKKQVALAQAEVRADLKQEVKAVIGFAAAAALAFTTFILLLMAAILAMAEELPGWQAALIVAGVVLAAGAIAGIIGWSKFVKKPLSVTQKTLKEDAQWAKERLT